MNRKKLGELLQQWHSSMSDPIYAVGSFYFAGSVYPNPWLVRDAIHSLEHTLQEDKDMLEGKPVMVVRFEKTVNLKDFAGYSDQDLKTNIDELTTLIAALRNQFKKDLCNHDIVDGFRKAHCSFDGGLAIIRTYYQELGERGYWRPTADCKLTMMMLEKVTEWSELVKEFCK